MHARINYPDLLLRKKSKLWPEGRLSMKFKKTMRHNVTVIGKSQFSKPDDNVFTANDEENYKETAD